MNRTYTTLALAEELECEDDYNYDDILEMDEDKAIMSGPWIYIPSRRIFLREGLYCVMDEDTGVHMPDFAMTMLWEGYDKIPELKDWDYMEQDGPCITLANYFHGKMTLEHVYEMECELIYATTDREAS